MLLKNYRLKKHLTQREVADKLDISVRQYQRIEASQSFPKKSTLIMLEDLFEVPHRILFAKSFDDVPDFLKHFLS